MKVKTRQELIKNPEKLKEHIVLLGAGASLAAFPEGDKNGQQLPVMNTLVQVLGIEKKLLANNIDPAGNFEEIYSSLTDEKLRLELEKKIFKYFSSLELPEKVTLYDYLLLSLRDKDAIFTFNWDPFLFDAYVRNRILGVSLPEIFFLHGNVRLFACPDHYKFGNKNRFCDECGKVFQDVPLLYPIANKNYQNQIYYTKKSWEEAQRRLASAFTVTIFGYGAPASDVEAVELLHKAWLARSSREMEHIEIIDTADEDTLAARWAAFAPTDHYHIVKSFKGSRLYNWPRRSCESLWYPMSQGLPCENFPFPETNSLEELQDYIREISNSEGNKMIPI